MAIKYTKYSAGIETDSGTSAPVGGYWPKGWKRWNSNVASGGSVGWICVTAGSPGTWREFALVSDI